MHNTIETLSETDYFGKFYYCIRLDSEGNKKKMLHRENGLPAIEGNNGSKFWYSYDKHHREKGPAIILSDGSQRFFVNGQRHRIDGPAIIYTDGRPSRYFLFDKEYSENEFRTFLDKKKLN